MNTKQEAIANADAHLSNAGLPTYTEMLAALRKIVDRDLAYMNGEVMGGYIGYYDIAQARTLTAKAALDTAARKADPRRFTGEPPTGFGALPCAPKP